MKKLREEMEELKRQITDKVSNISKPIVIKVYGFRIWIMLGYLGITGQVPETVFCD